MVKIKEIILYKHIYLYILLIPLSGCATLKHFDEQYISDQIEQRSGFRSNTGFSDSLKIPPGVSLEDSLTVEESVAIALWNNPQFQVDLTELGFARADLLQAGLLPNPVFSLLFPLGPKQLEFTLYYAIDILWQRPKRVAAAKANTERVAESLVNNGLGLVRNVYFSFTDLHKASECLKVLDEEAEISTEMLKIAEARLLAGDISKTEETAIKLAALRIRESALNARHDYEIQKIRFLTLLGLISGRSDVQIDPLPVNISEIPGQDEMVESALASRPDLRAAELEIEIAGAHLGWERSRIFSLTAMLDANGQGTEGFEMGPGLQVEVPLFNLNQGGTKRARAEMQRSVNQYINVQQKIIGGVLESYHGYLSSREVYEILAGQTLPEAEQAAGNGELAYLAGEISYIEYLDLKMQYLDARLRFLNAEADINKNLASVYYETGWKIKSAE